MTTERAKTRLIIMGAAGRDFHDFNVYWRERADIEVVGFTATQIPGIDERRYPPELSGPRYPDGIPIHAEADLASLIDTHAVDLVAMAYSDVPHAYVMHRAALVNACGAAFCMLGTRQTMLASCKPVIAVCAARTGSGKSQVSRAVSAVLKEEGRRIAIVRHPMPYGDLRRQVCQRFETPADLDRHECTIEEREEYEPHLVAGSLVFAGIDYEMILRQAEQEADVILWDGGNNDTAFYRPDLQIVVVDPHRPGHEASYYPGETNVRLADLVIVNKVATANPADVERVERSVRALNPRAELLRARSPVTLSDPEQVAGKRVLVIEDGPTLTHGEMTYGAGHVAARAAGAAQIIDPRPYARGSIKDVFRKYTHLTEILPAMGYGREQMAELEASINAADCDLVVVGTPIDLGVFLKNVNKPMVRARYDLDPVDPTILPRVIKEMLASWEPLGTSADHLAQTGDGTLEATR